MNYVAQYIFNAVIFNVPEDCVMILTHRLLVEPNLCVFTAAGELALSHVLVFTTGADL